MIVAYRGQHSSHYCTAVLFSDAAQKAFIDSGVGASVKRYSWGMK
eukprot:COSAG01_NODE_73092_length_251_cov_0.677632_1_plen_44_part_01